MKFSLGELLPLKCCEDKTLKQQLKMQTIHFEKLKRRKLTKSELTELWQVIQADDLVKKQQLKRFGIKLVISVVICLIVIPGTFIYLLFSGAFH